MKIVIDPGHGGQDRSNRGPTGYIEADGVLDIGLKLRELLTKEGYTVKMTRETDTTVSLSERSRIANDWQGNLFISLHTNAAANPSANGIETFHSYNGVDGDRYRKEAKGVAEILQNRLVAETGLRDRGVKTRLVTAAGSSLYGRDYYAVIRATRMPSLIVEMGFHSNPEEEALLKTNSFRQKLAEGIVKAIKEAYPLNNNGGNDNDNVGSGSDGNLTSTSMRVTVDGTGAVVEGFMLNGRFYVPIRFLEVYNYNVNYNGATKSIIINKK